MTLAVEDQRADHGGDEQCHNYEGVRRDGTAILASDDCGTLSCGEISRCVGQSDDPTIGKAVGAGGTHTIADGVQNVLLERSRQGGEIASYTKPKSSVDDSTGVIAFGNDDFAFIFQVGRVRWGGRQSQHIDLLLQLPRPLPTDNLSTFLRKHNGQHRIRYSNLQLGQNLVGQRRHRRNGLGCGLGCIVLQSASFVGITVVLTA
mmetsp:Transcript_31146/g.91253  ORF Transcript_31146/g.91253 Transcript_31146/m.91253 type:complete len:204 (-) Transcript_31146:1523-2134(-)